MRRSRIEAKAKFSAGRPATIYKASQNKMADIVMTDLPRIPLYTRFADYAVQKNVQRFEYWLHAIRTSGSSARSEQCREGSRIGRRLCS
jgi:hypothetical protein